MPELICRRIGQFCGDHLSSDGAKLAGALAAGNRLKEPINFTNGRKCFRGNADPTEQNENSGHPSNSACHFSSFHTEIAAILIGVLNCDP